MFHVKHQGRRIPAVLPHSGGLIAFLESPVEDSTIEEGPPRRRQVDTGWTILPELTVTTHVDDLLHLSDDIFSSPRNVARRETINPERTIPWPNQEEVRYLLT